MSLGEENAYGPLLNDGYRPRIVERRIAEGLEDFGAVCIEGAKHSGKTWTGRAFASSEINLMDPAGNFQNLEIAQLDPPAALDGPTPRLIDEWQEAPQLWDGVRNAVDRSGKQRTFLLTGSSIPRKKTGTEGGEPSKHTGVGRIEKLRMRTMTLSESGESNCAVSFEELFSGEPPRRRPRGSASPTSPRCPPAAAGPRPSGSPRPGRSAWREATSRRYARAT